MKLMSLILFNSLAGLATLCVYSITSAGTIAGLHGIESVTIWEDTQVVTTDPLNEVILPISDNRLSTRLALLDASNHDFAVFRSGYDEFYDFFFSNSDGTPNPTGAYLTVESNYNPPSTSNGGNISAVTLNYLDGHSELATFVSNFVTLGPGDASTVGNAVDGNLNTSTLLGNTVGSNQRLSLTLGFAATVTHAALFYDDFENGDLDKWTIGGRQQGYNNVAEVIDIEGDFAAHLHHESFTEITIEKSFEYSPFLIFDFDMKTKVSSQASSTSAFYANAGFIFQFYDSSDQVIGVVIYYKSTSSWRFDYTGDPPSTEYIRLFDNGEFSSYHFEIQDILSNIIIDETAISKVQISFAAYASGWPYNMIADVWVDNFLGSVGSDIVSALPETPEVTLPTQENSKLVVSVHGLNTNPGVWPSDLNKAFPENEWDRVAPNWEEDAATNPLKGYYMGMLRGMYLGKGLSCREYDLIHFIGHSAGAKVINQAMRQITEDFNRDACDDPNVSKPQMYATFLDSYTPNHFDVFGSSSYGAYADFAESFVYRDVLPYTNAYLQNAYNFDITSLYFDPLFGHSTPHQWYRCSTGVLVDDEQADIDCNHTLGDGTLITDYGFPRSPAGVLGAKTHDEFLRGFLATPSELILNTGIAFDYVENKIKRTIAFGKEIVDAANSKVKSTVTYLSSVINSFGKRVVSETYNFTANCFFDGNNCALDALLNPQLGFNILILSGVDWIYAYEGSPAWAFFGFQSSEDISYLELEYQFLSNGDGRFGIFINDQFVQLLDENLAADGIQHILIPLAEVLPAGSHSIAFRLEPSDDDGVQSVIRLRNLSFGRLEDIKTDLIRIVDIDIKPGETPNSLRLDSQGDIPVAILGASSLNAQDIDSNSLSFNGLSVRADSINGHLCSTEDVNGDGFHDLICQFEDNASLWQQGVGDSATVTGLLNDGVIFEGSDSMSVMCEVNGDYHIDLLDIRAIGLARNQLATGSDDPMDWDQNGVINLLDARGCQQACTLPRCAIQ